MATTLSPREMLKLTSLMVKTLEDMQRKGVFVGLPNENVGGKVYGDGRTVLSVGATHEFGAPQQDIPQRSFLRIPFRLKADQINKAIAAQYEAATTKGLEVDIALGRIGVIAVNISKGAFTSLGYGDWEPITAETARRKGSTQTLIDTGILRSSISYVVRGE